LIGKRLKSTGDSYNAKYSELLGNPEWCDQGIRNLTLRAIAPNTSSALICGGVSQGIEPIIANVFVQKTAKGTFIRINPTFKKYIQENFPDKDNTDFYYNVGTDFKGSIQHLDFIPNDVKEIFLTAYEINQLELVRNAAIWTKYIDQGISLNLFFPADVDPKWVSKCHITAWEEGVKTLYYVRTESITSRDMKSSTFDDCFYCQ
jgi:ribonucleoside-diphosphate reductase alpha chain